MTWLIVGLGNPGPEYAATRHNVGFFVAEEMCRRVSARLARHKRAHALVAEGRLGLPGSSQSIIVAEPQSFMNESGGPVKAIMQFYGVDEGSLIVVHDELDSPFQAIRVKLGGGDTGHNGLRSIRRSLGNGDFLRVRMGIGRPPGRQDPAAFVLKPFASVERLGLELMVERGADAVESLIANGLERTQNAFNTNPTP